MRIARRLFVVPLANNDHGKTTMIRALVNQGQGTALTTNPKSVRSLTSPWGRPIDAYVFGRSYQEVEKDEYGSVEAALDGNDPDWRTRELIIMPSHAYGRTYGIKNGNGPDDLDQMIDAAHGAGFDVVCATIIFTGETEDDRTKFADIWRKPWDLRWTIPNPWVAKPESRDGQLEALGRDLWAWICQALAS
ncbi:hypothetical protein [Burkholderia ubonensis]|uniref:hypothetical protein n=1 Tax=Burkholderia ubonensis TaxID=101571 RepID=UPI000758D4DF|nr:hypothetical protein [Burkholderia ubonensis]KVQ92659.1 hypothetical protein WK10_26555 [Burkholderia ubonensis]KVZ33907.1 hypothetical protein WL17_26855 [Burkholderia ubonensis]KWK76799.1 hypothetical protein WM17_27615 [Burkholderia ubonensis]KWK91322.1 hypothetical protein WM18_20780 [Burkholderia ubonensis]